VSYWAALPYIGLYARTDDAQGEIGLRADLALPSRTRPRRAVRRMKCHSLLNDLGC